MAHIKLENVDLCIPIFDYNAQSLRRGLIKGTIGSNIETTDAISRVHALRNVSLEIKNGESVGVVGDNGAGKSSFLRLLSGIYMPTSGHCSIEGDTLSIISLADGLEPSLSGRENIYRVGLMRGYDFEFLREHEEHIIEFSELNDFIDLPVRTYSSGMHLRLIFSVITTVNMDILLLDEFFAVGDAAFRSKAKARIDEMIDDAKIFVFASHSMDLIKEYCNRVFLFNQGEVEEIDKSELNKQL
jgi:lipopolysaccharide transport system ATP-binding protein